MPRNCLVNSMWSSAVIQSENFHHHLIAAYCLRASNKKCKI
jgi:hypothetical protein